MVCIGRELYGEWREDTGPDDYYHHFMSGITSGMRCSHDIRNVCEEGANTHDIGSQ